MAPTTIQKLLGLNTPPIGVTYQPNRPAGLPHVAAPGPSGCSYWKRAADGETFYTEAADHYNCPVGAYTHNVELPPDQLQQLHGVVTTMVGLGYLRAEEVPGIPRRSEPFGIAIYGPLNDHAAPVDVVLLRGNARQMMLVQEAALAAGVNGSAPLMGRPTCAALPEALQTGRGVSSLGCIGNRVYTELDDNSFYYVLPGKHLSAVTAQLETIVNANRELEKYHQARKTLVSGDRSQ